MRFWQINKLALLLLPKVLPNCQGDSRTPGLRGSSGGAGSSLDCLSLSDSSSVPREVFVFRVQEMPPSESWESFPQRKPSSLVLGFTVSGWQPTNSSVGKQVSAEPLTA